MAGCFVHAVTRSLLVCLAVNLFLCGTAHAAVARLETVSAGQEGDSPLVLPVIAGGPDQTYVLLIATRRNDDVTAVTGGGLTWIEHVEQCSGREQQGIRLWTAQGSPEASFEVSIAWDEHSGHPIVAVLSRYSGVGSLESPTGENTHGESGACDDGTDTDTPQLTLTSTMAGSVHMIGVNSRRDPITTHSPGYTEIASIDEGSSGEKTTLTTFDRTLDPAGTDAFEATIDSDRDWCTAGIVLNPVAGATDTVATLVTATGLWLRNAELLWIRAQSADDAAFLIVGELLTSQPGWGKWLYFLRSECLEWNETLYGCLESELEVDLLPNVEYDLVAWTEALDRVEPDRDLRLVAQRWRYRPGDIDLDGLVSCTDVELFWADPYDWNRDGEITPLDTKDVMAAAAATMRDLDGNGIIDEADSAILVDHWGPCPDPPAPCPGDLDCDGVVGVGDLLLMLDP